MFEIIWPLVMTLLVVGYTIIIYKMGVVDGQRARSLAHKITHDCKRKK